MALSGRQALGGIYLNLTHYGRLAWKKLVGLQFEVWGFFACIWGCGCAFDWFLTGATDCNCSFYFSSRRHATGVGLSVAVRCFFGPYYSWSSRYPSFIILSLGLHAVSGHNAETPTACEQRSCAFDEASRWWRRHGGGGMVAVLPLGVGRSCLVFSGPRHLVPRGSIYGGVFVLMCYDMYFLQTGGK